MIKKGALYFLRAILLIAISWADRTPNDHDRLSQKLQESLIRQRVAKPLLLDQKTVVQTSGTQAGFDLNLGQNPGELPGSFFRFEREIFSNLKGVYENGFTLPMRSENIGSDRYQHHDRIGVEWQFLPKTSLRGSYSTRDDHDLALKESLTSQSTTKEWGLLGWMTPTTQYEIGYRISDSLTEVQEYENRFWHAYFQQSLSPQMKLFWTGQYSESLKDQSNVSEELKWLSVGSGAELSLTERVSAQLRFDVRMKEEAQPVEDRSRWVEQEKRVSFSLQTDF